MKKTTLSTLCIVALVASLMSSAKAQSYTGIVSFGDSLSDIGNTVTTLDNLFGTNFTRENTGYNANFYDNGRFSDGSLWEEVLNAKLGLPSLVANDGINNFSGTDFAWAGSTSGTGNTSFILRNLQTQIGSYTNQLATNNPALPTPATTLFTVWSGGNDVINLVDSSNAITPIQVAQNISNSITSLYNAGGRSFLVPNLPPLGFKPNYLTNSAKMQQANDFVDAYDPLLQSALDSLATDLPGIRLTNLDVYSIFTNMITNPGNYGLTNVTESSYTASTNAPLYGSVVTNPDAYLFWDQTHGTATVNSILGNAAYAAVVPEPVTWGLLLTAALVALVFRKTTQRESNE